MNQVDLSKTEKEICNKYGNKIPGYPPYYRITRDGKVYCGRTGKWVEVTMYKYLNGYVKGLPSYRPKVNLDGKPKLLYRLLAITYIPNPDNKPFVCHKDNDPMNWDLSNLYWGTQKENMRQCKEDNRHPYMLSGTKHSQSKLTKKQVDKIRSSNLTHNELAIKYKVSRRTIDRIIRGENYNGDL